MDKAKRKYYSKRRKRLYGSDSEDENSRKSDEGFVELKPEVVEFDRLHQREEELYFYDAFAYPWEKDKHYKMVYQLEKKYFPDQCLDKAFLQPGETSKKGDDSGKVREKKKKVVALGGKRNGVKGIGMEKCDEDDDGDEKLVFFDEVTEEEKKKPEEEVVTEKKVEQFFKGLTKSPNEKGVASGGDGEPFLVTRNGELPPMWDGPNGTVLLVNKPKGWTSFTVCGKLRRLVKVKKVGHAGTLDPMATGLLIVCIGKATKVVDRYRGMIKGYSGIFRLGEATSTLDADSPVIQRESWEHIKDDDIKKALTSFLGEIWAWIVDSPWIAKNIKNASVSSALQIQDCGAYINCPNCSYRVDNSNVATPWPGLPKGVKFEPTDEEVIEHLEAKCGVKKDGVSVFFFNKTAHAYQNGQRKRRKIAPTCLTNETVRWHKTGQTKPVMVNGVRKGSKKIMVLYKSGKKVLKPEKTNWVLHQYHLGTEEGEIGDFVVSKITYQKSKELEKNIDESDSFKVRDETSTPKTTSPTQTKSVVSVDEDEIASDDIMMVLGSFAQEHSRIFFWFYIREKS